MKQEAAPTALGTPPNRPSLTVNTDAPVPSTSSNGPPLTVNSTGGLKVEGSLAPDEREGRSAATLLSPSPRLPGSTPSRPSTPISFQHSPKGPQKLLKRLRSLRHQLAKPPPPSAPSLSRRPSYAARRPTVVEAPEPFGPLPAPTALERQAIKIRLITWNMYDSLPDPSGDLSEFLGEVKGWRKRQTSLSTAGSKRGSVAGSIVSVAAPASLPAFPLTAEHPYHLIVVAGQECPTASGVLAGKMPRAWDGRGWTSMLESWLCGDCPEDSDDDLGRRSTDGSEGGAGSTRSRTTASEGEEDEEELRRSQGPYVLVEKERLMPGIYIAVFVSRSCQGFVEATSKGRVTAGLLGGRIGNKGGVAISLSFAGSRLLFISAHLAAHASGLEIRKANVRKILEEMEIDDFTGLPARHGGDVSDRFDQAFFLGDLNFRLNISRLHADFLVKSKSFATALEFDQLRGVLAEENSVFKGFQEAPICFAPTYKYDVLAKVKRKRSGLLRPKPSVSKHRHIDTVIAPPDSPSNPVLTPIPAESSPVRRDIDTLSVKSASGSLSSAMSDYVGIEQSDCNSSPLPTSGPASMEAVRRAQVRFLTLVRKNSGAPALARTTSGSGSSSPRSLLFGANSPSSPRPILTTSHSFNGSPSSPCGDDSSEDEAEVHMEPIFDSSSKQRVQSYTDRILIKTNVGKLQLTQSRTLGDLIVDSIKGLVQGGLGQQPDKPPSPSLHHSYFAARPALDHPSRKIKDGKSSQSWSDVASVAGEPRHFRFANFFGRTPRRGARGLSSRSVDSLVSPSTSPAEPVVAQRKLTRARSLNATRSARRSSFANPTSPDPPAVGPPVLTFWRKVSGAVPSILADLTPVGSTPTPLSPTTSPTLVESPAPAASTSPSRPSTPPPIPPPSPSTLSRKERRSQSLVSPPRPSLRKDGNSDPLVRQHRADGSVDTTVSVTPSYASTRPASHSSTLPIFFRTPTSRNPSRAPTRAPSNSNSNTRGRFKSFFHFLPLPFLSTAAKPEEEEVVLPPPPEPEMIGPRLGEIEVLEYNAVVDLAAMGATSDHRPVFAVVAIGIGEE